MKFGYNDLENNNSQGDYKQISSIMHGTHVLPFKGEGRIETCYEFGLSVKQIVEKLSVSEEYVERVLELETENV